MLLTPEEKTESHPEQ